MDTRTSIFLAIVTFLAGVAVTWVFYRRGYRERRPSYIVTGNRVVAEDPRRGIEVTFRGEKVPVVSRTLVAVWNDGRETIRRTDVPEGAPLTISIDGANRILEARVAATTRPEIGFRTHLDPPDVVLCFDHLDHKDGATIEILHTGPNPYNASLTGDVIGTQGQLAKIESPLWDDPAGPRAAFSVAGSALLFASLAVIGGELFLAAGALSIALLFVELGYMYRMNDRRRLPNALWRDVPGGLPFILGRTSRRHYR